MTLAPHVPALADALSDLIARTGKGRLPDYATYVRALFAHVAPEDVLREPLPRQEARTLGFWQWGEKREGHGTHLRVYNPPVSGGAWRHEATFIEIITDDMPFLVDSVSTELARLNLPARLMLHPVYSVTRDAQGVLIGLKVEKAEGMQRESWIHISIERQSSEALDGIAAMLRKVLADVQLAVTDWKDMRAAVRAAITALPQQVPPSTGPEVVQEGQNFLRWLDEDQFVFLGYRAYQLSADGTRLDLVPDSARGLLRDSDLMVLRGLRRFSELPDTVQGFIASPEIIFVNKTQARSTVHRPAPYDIIGIKQYDSAGRFAGLRLFIGLFTSGAYNRSAQDVPWLRLKVAEVLQRSGLDPRSHSGKALLHILNTYPRDDLFQIGLDDLCTISHGILLLAERQRTALFVWRDPFRRFVSCLIYSPRDHYDTALREKFVALLEKAFGGRLSGFATGFIMDSPLVRLQVTLDLNAPPHLSPDLAALEQQLIEAARGWDDRFADLVMATYGDTQGTALRTRYTAAFPVIYRTGVSPEQAAEDVAYLESIQGADPLALTLHAGEGQQLHLRLYHRETPLALSDVLPRLENMGLRIISEVPYVITPRTGAPCWISALLAESRTGQPIDLPKVREAFIAAFHQLGTGGLEDDRFNQLTLTQGLSWREVSVLRAYARYLQQAGFKPTPSFICDTLCAHGVLAKLFVQLFHARFNPAGAGDAAALEAQLREQLDAVTSLAEDEVLRRTLDLILCTLRTNYYQLDAAGQPKPYIAFKIDSQKLMGLPLPRPFVEIWVYSPRVEAVHLRGGRVARGGIRWSDRRDDFRTEVLGLMKAQVVKNAVIVPVGSKGGFYCKQLPSDRMAEGKEVIACYQTFMRGLLDLTDNRTADGVVPPPQVVRHDGDDPYLVVAADKGTARFSDIANALSLDYGFWLGDAFASGGSAGYDHKAMGITARGAWESVKRHFRELGRDIQTTPFTCVGVGDMAGDVFGNGLLRSPHTLMVAAFNHKHIFLDPNPDAAVSYAERARLFALPGSQWSDYAADKISAGGGVYERAAKSIPLSPQVQARFGLTEDKMAPAALVQALLKADVDLLYLGGIGTFIKASDETHADASDKANDALRVNGAEVRAKVIGEGANLGVTSRARIELARRGVRLNSDAIDNSAGVDTSDHEVNIKIALQPELAQGTLTGATRDKLLASMTDDVAALVLRDNYLQPQLITLEQQQAPQLLEAHGRLMETLEKAGRLDRTVEFLPSREEIARRAAAGEGLTRPEIALLVAHAKLALCDAVTRSTLPDDAAAQEHLFAYFPAAMQRDFAPAIKAHRLRREIVATVLSNEVVNRLGTTFTQNLAERRGIAEADVVRAYLVVRQAYDLPGFWAQIEALDNKVSNAVQQELLRAGMDMAARAVSAVLAHHTAPLDVAALAKGLGAQLATLTASLGTLLPKDAQERLATVAQQWSSKGVPEALALRAAQLAPLAAAPDLQRVAAAAQTSLDVAAGVYYASGAQVGLDALRQATEALRTTDYWQRQMVQALVEDLYGVQQRLAVRILAQGGDVAAWSAQHAEALARYEAMRRELRAARSVDLPMLAMAVRVLKSLTGA